MNKLLLASTSQTRKKILSNVGIKFINKPPLINEEKEKEKLKKTKKPEKICQNLAKLKSTATSLKYLPISIATCLIILNAALRSS